MRGKGFIIALGLAALIYLVFVRPLLISDEARIRKGVREGARAIEAEDLENCLRHVSLHYKDEYGLTYLSVKGLLIRIFQEFDAFEIELENLRITLLDKRTAFATFDLKVKVSYRGQRAYLLGSGDLSNRIRMSFAKEGGRWKVTQVEGVEAHGIGRTLPKVGGDGSTILCEVRQEFAGGKPKIRSEYQGLCGFRWGIELSRGRHRGRSEPADGGD